eukprot:5002729-Pleurochrysis_carterae.AAC.2
MFLAFASLCELTRSDAQADETGLTNFVKSRAEVLATRQQPRRSPSPTAHSAAYTPLTWRGCTAHPCYLQCRSSPPAPNWPNASGRPSLVGPPPTPSPNKLPNNPVLSFRAPKQLPS